MQHFADFLAFSEEVQEAFDSYNIEATSLTIKNLNKNIGPIIGRVVWRSCLLKVGKDKNTSALHFTLMDADKAEITGTAWGLIAQRFHEVLQQGQIYKFSNAVPLSKKLYQPVKNDSFESRVLNQSILLRFSGLVYPEVVKQINYPDMDFSQCRTDYSKVQIGQVASVVGFVTAMFVYEGERYLCLSTGKGECIGVSYSEAKMEELKELPIVPRHTVLGILGVGKLKDINTKTTGDRIPKALFKTFSDSLFVIEPNCASTEQLVIWRDELMEEQYKDQQ